MSLTRIQRGFLDTGAVIVPDNIYTTAGTASSSTFLRGDGAWATTNNQSLNTNSSVTFANLTVTNTVTTQGLIVGSSEIYLAGLNASTSTAIMFYNTATGQISYGAPASSNNQSLNTNSSVTFANLTVTNTVTTQGLIVGSSEIYLAALSASTSTSLVYYNTITGQITYGPSVSSLDTSTTQVAYATTAGFALSFNTATLVTTAVSILNTSTTQVGYATTAGFALSFNTATLVTTAVSLLNTSTTQVGYATTAGFALLFNTATLVTTAVSLLNTSTTQVGYATTAGSVIGVVVDTVYTLANVSGTLTPAISSGSVHVYTLTGNITLNALSSPVAGSNITLILKQDATGNRTMTSTMKWANGSKTLSTIASSTDIVSVFYDGTNYWASLGRGFV
jgi:hypothetical protein